LLIETSSAIRNGIFSFGGAPFTRCMLRECIALRGLEFGNFANRLVQGPARWKKKKKKTSTLEGRRMRKTGLIRQLFLRGGSDGHSTKDIAGAPRFPIRFSSSRGIAILWSILAGSGTARRYCPPKCLCFFRSQALDVRVQYKKKRRRRVQPSTKRCTAVTIEDD